MSKTFISALKNRGRISISGEDSADFLQGLISQDIHLLDQQPLIYGCLLSPQGKFHHDFFISKEDDHYFVDCEGGARAENLSKRLTMFKLRSKVSITLHDDVTVTVGNTDNPETAFIDPRLKALGWRDYSSSHAATDSFDTYDQHRLSLGIPDGSRDMIIDKSTLIECRLDKLNAISFKKGCYMGQEMTARMHYRGLAKKHLTAFKVSKNTDLEAPITTCDGKSAGEWRSSHGEFAMALVKDAMIDDLPTDIQLINQDWIHDT